MTKSLVITASNGSIVPDLMTIMYHLTCSTSFGLAPKKIYGIQINSTLWGIDEMISGRKKLKSSERTCSSTILSTILSCWPLGTEPWHPQWEADNWLYKIQHYLLICHQFSVNVCVLRARFWTPVYVGIISLGRTANLCSLDFIHCQTIHSYLYP